MYYAKVLNDPPSRRIMTGVIFLRRILDPGHYSMGVIIRRYTGCNE